MHSVFLGSRQRSRSASPLFLQLFPVFSLCGLLIFSPMYFILVCFVESGRTYPNKMHQSPTTAQYLPSILYTTHTHRRHRTSLIHNKQTRATAVRPCMVVFLPDWAGAAERQSAQCYTAVVAPPNERTQLTLGLTNEFFFVNVG